MGPTNLADRICSIGRGLAAISPELNFPSKYLLYYLRFSVSELERHATGSTFQAISGKQLREHLISLPPIEESLRITEEIERYLSRIDDTVASLERVQSKLKQYRASVLKAAVEGRLVPTEAELARKENRDYEPASELLKRILEERREKWIEGISEKGRAKSEEKAKKAGKDWTAGDDRNILESERIKAGKKYKEPVAPDADGLPELPEGWCWTTIDQMVHVGTGATPKRGLTKYWAEGDIPWVTSGVVNRESVSTAIEHVTKSALDETNLSLYPPGTLLLAMYGEGKTRGKFSELKIEATTNQALAALVFDGMSSVCRDWLKLFLEYNYLQIRQHASGGVQPNLNLGIIRHIHLPLPPASDQLRIAQYVQKLLSLATDTDLTVNLQSRRALRLQQSILKQAFEGKLVDQDPNDEPASVLLERIKAERAANKADMKKTGTRSPKVQA